MTQALRFGPAVKSDGVTFRLWAPGAKKVELVLAQQPQDPLPMQPNDGWYELAVPSAKPGARYQFKIDGDVDIPDPASHFQPDDAHQASEVVDHAYRWQAADWKGRPWSETVLSEIHVGTYTPEGTFRAIIGKLDHLAATGITAIELMPISDFPGRWNWGYDGVLPFAPDSVYGTPDDLKALIDAAHARGLMMFLDVVYNHFGPEANYLARVAPTFFTDAQTPWGNAIDYRLPEVRAFAIENALHWLRDYRFDGLRLDAVHAIVSPGNPNVLQDLSAAAGELARVTGRRIHLVLENDDNASDLLVPHALHPEGRYTAQWNDDYHHAWHVLLTGETSGYYRDYEDAGRHLARAIAEGFAYQGEPSPHRKGRKRGQSSKALPPAAFVNFLQNHDQIGNRALGERLTVLAGPAALEAALAILLLSPAPPLLFMGEEWGATEPFPFFCDFSGDLAEAVRNGRKKEFAEAYAGSANDVPDPLAETTKQAATLDWSKLAQPVHRARLELTRKLLHARKQHIMTLMPLLEGGGSGSFQSGILSVQWQGKTKRLTLLANLSNEARSAAAHPSSNQHSWDTPVWGGTPGDILPPWSVHFALGSI